MVFVIVGMLVAIMLVTYPFIKDEMGLGSSKQKPSIYDVEGWLQLGIGFITILMLIAAVNLFGDYDYYVYLRIATTATAVFLAYYILKYNFRPSLLLAALLATMILYNPIEPVTMPRNEWILFNLGTAVILPLLAHYYVAEGKAKFKAKLKSQ